MAVYDKIGTNQFAIYGTDGRDLNYAYNLDGNKVYKKGYSTAQTYLGGYIEIQPDSWDGSTPVNDTIVQPSDPTAWGFPMSLSNASMSAIKSDILKGDGTGIMYIRFPLGFAYRGARNIDPETELSKNFGERWDGQNSSLADWFSDIVKAGGGLAPEYWCIPPYWLTSGSLSGSNNQLRAGGSYPQSTTLSSIRQSDKTQYDAQIDDFTDAVIDDLEYLNKNIAPVVMFGLSNEPTYGSQKYGACKWEAQTYNDVLEILYPKLLSVFPNIKLHVASSDESSPFTGIASTFISKHSNWLWGYSHHSMRLASGEVGDGADSYYKSSEYSNMKGTKENVFINEYEYFSTSSRTNEFRCANNMIHLIDEMVYGGAEVLHPIIHICKPMGQFVSSTNTSGYCLYAVDMSDGSYTVNDWAYNSWKMFNDNLLIGSKLITDFSVDLINVGFMATIKDDKLRLFMANCSSDPIETTIGFDVSKTFSGKLYNLANVGTVQSDVSGSSIMFTIPAYSGLVYIEK